MNVHNKYYYFLGSALLHLLVILHFSVRSITVRDHQNVSPIILPSYVMTQQTSHALLKATCKRTQRANISAQGITASQANTHSTTSSALSGHPVVSASLTHDILLSMLHDAIAEHQYYPDSAIALKQAGTVTLQLQLYPDGHMTHIAVINSSGFSSIDLAALDAVRAVHLIQHAGEYLTAAETFKVQVIFVA